MRPERSKKAHHLGPRSTYERRQTTIEAKDVDFYAATPLDPSIHEIRLLWILPGEPGEKIRCTLFKDCLESFDNTRRRSLSLNPQYSCGYTALSYTWGRRTMGKSISIDGQDGFAVTDNLARALYRIRWKSEPRLLWTDAICINQNNIIEQGH